MGFDRDELHASTTCDEDLECPICMGVCIDAVACPCGHTFCRLCVERSLEKNKSCPLCRQSATPEALQPQPLLNLRVNSLVVCCDRRCGWHGRCDERRAHAKACPVARATEFTARLHGEAGWQLEETHNGQLMVRSLGDEGSTMSADGEVAGRRGSLMVSSLAVAKHNARFASCPTRRIRVGCVIAEVNGQRGDPRELLFLLDKLAQRECGYAVVLKQPLEFSTTVIRNSKSMGLELKYREAHECLEINAVMPEGAVMEHNRGNTRERLKSHDMILEVNGVQGTAPDMLKAMQSSETCALRVCRLPQQ